MAETASKITGQEAIDAFMDAAQPGLCYVWAYSPNGGDGNASGQDYWMTEESLADLLSSGDPETGERKWADDCIIWDGETLFLSDTPERSVHQYYECQWLASEWDGKSVVMCRGAHYGSEWGASCDEIETFPLARELQTDVLQNLIEESSGNYLLCERVEAVLGLEELGDPTDDGANWAVVNESRFLRAVELCRRAQIKADTFEGSADYCVERFAELIADKLDREVAK